MQRVDQYIAQSWHDDALRSCDEYEEECRVYQAMHAAELYLIHKQSMNRTNRVVSEYHRKRDAKRRKY